MAPFTPRINKKEGLETTINAIYKNIPETFKGFQCNAGGINSSFIRRVCYNSDTKKLRISFSKTTTKAIVSEYEYDLNSTVLLGLAGVTVI